MCEGFDAGRLFPGVGTQTPNARSGNLVFVVHGDKAEGSRVDEPHLSPILHLGHEVSVSSCWLVAVGDRESA